MKGETSISVRRVTTGPFLCTNTGHHCSSSMAVWRETQHMQGKLVLFPTASFDILSIPEHLDFSQTKFILLKLWVMWDKLKLKLSVLLRKINIWKGHWRLPWVWTETMFACRHVSDPEQRPLTAMRSQQPSWHLVALTLKKGFLWHQSNTTEPPWLPLISQCYSTKERLSVKSLFTLVPKCIMPFLVVM